MSLTTLTVTSREALTPGMVRVHFRADGAAVADAENTDRYVKLVFTASGEKLPADTNLRELRASLPADEQPRVRTYTVRSADSDSGAVAIDFVTHSGPSVAAAWAEAAEPGDEIQVAGPGGAYVPDPEATTSSSPTRPGYRPRSPRSSASPPVPALRCSPRSKAQSTSCP